MGVIYSLEKNDNHYEVCASQKTGYARLDRIKVIKAFSDFDDALAFFWFLKDRDEEIRSKG